MIAPTIHPGRGRGISHTLEHAQAMIQRWQASGQGPQQWCRDQGILPSLLSSWRRRVRGTVLASEVSTAVMPAFVPVRRHAPEPMVTHDVIVDGTGRAAVRLTLPEMVTLMRLLGEQP